MTNEPTVLDFVKALLTPWRGAPPPIPPLHIETVADEIQSVEILEPQPSPAFSAGGEELEAIPEASGRVRIVAFPWRGTIAVLVALIAQLSLEPGPDRSWGAGLTLYLIAATWGVWSILRGEWNIPDLRGVASETDDLSVNRGFLWVGAVAAMLAFLTLGGNRFTHLNLLLWSAAVLFICLALWKSVPAARPRVQLVQDWLIKNTWSIGFSRSSMVLFAVGALVVFFRVFRLSDVPPEMVGDHAEKLMDIWDVLHGETLIFFPRNTGREAFQMYLTAAVIKIFGTGISFTSMKIGTTLAGLATLPFIYLLGKELGSPRAGILAAAFAGIAYWPNVITRIALRFTLYPLFVAPTLYFLIRGLRRGSRNDFLLAGLSLGLGLHGYTPFRIMPVIVLLAGGLYLLHSESRQVRRRTILYLSLLVLVALLVFLPLLRFWIENPELFNYRAFTRLGELERPLPGPAALIFLQNLIRALTMFAWNNGEIWPVSIPNRPALDVVSAAFFYLGAAAIFLRYLLRRSWVDLFLLLTIPMLMLPSILSLAFPSENPALNRTAGAMVPVFVIIGLTLDGFLRGIQDRVSSLAGNRLAWTAGIFLLLWSAFQNYDLVFRQYQRSYTLASWNTTEIGQVIRDFAEIAGSADNAYVVAFPHWVDTRLVGINAGFPTRDFALWPENFPSTLESPGPKLFVVKFDDTASLNDLELLYPDGYLKLFDSQFENKDFYLYFVFPDNTGSG